MQSALTFANAMIILESYRNGEPMTNNQVRIADFGRRMMDLAAVHQNDQISNELSRIGNRLAETASLDGLTELEKKVIRYARQIIYQHR